MASKLSHCIRWRRVEIGSIDLVQSENELDAPWSETARHELRVPLFYRYRIVVDRSPEISVMRAATSGHVKPIGPVNT